MPRVQNISVPDDAERSEASETRTDSAAHRLRADGMVLAPVQNRGREKTQNRAQNGANVHFRKRGEHGGAPVRRGAPPHFVAGRGNLPGLGHSRDEEPGRLAKARYGPGGRVAHFARERRGAGQQRLLVPEEVVPGIRELRRQALGNLQHADPNGPLAALPGRDPRGGGADDAAQLAKVPDAAQWFLRLVQALHRSPDHQVHGRI